MGEQHARWYSTAGEQLGSYDYSDYYLKDFDFGGSGFLTLVLNMYQAGNRYQVTTVGAAGEALGSLDFDEQILDFSAAGPPDSFGSMTTPCTSTRRPTTTPGRRTSSSGQTAQ